jgi:uncharacterized protein YbjT (DUF2867 family)
MVRSAAMKRAIVLGATGLVGREVVDLLEQDSAIEHILLLVRRAPDRPAAKKTEVRITNFREPASFGFEGDVLYSALGTTLKVAGSKEAQWEVDYTFQYEVAKAAKVGGVTTYGLVSSLGASAKASSFYTKMKGELDEAVQKLGFERVRIVRPSFLEGARSESRAGEKVALFAMKGLGMLPGISKYRSIPVRTVAKALIALTNDPAAGTKIVDSNELFALGG